VLHRVTLVALPILVAIVGDTARAAPSFEGKVITLVVGYPAGGGVDASARLIAPYLAKLLPGKPDIIVQNRPGADGMSAANYFAHQAKPDGLTFLAGSGGITSPVNYRGPEAKYNPTAFSYIGGIARSGSVMLISAAAEKRLHDKAAEPVIMGAFGTTPYPSQQITAWGIEFLGWNAKWVMGYRGIPDVSLALERGEVEMTSTSNPDLVRRLTKDGKFKALAQTGGMVDGKPSIRPEFRDIPLFKDMMEGKIADPVQGKGFAYWLALQNISTWFALPPGTPRPILDTYRQTYVKMGQDPEFIERSKKIAEDFTLQTGADVESAVATVDETPKETLDYMHAMLRRQGAAASN
jgi:tripartite-type tricarboxylate transporter receptor subunit TctC